MVEPSALPPGEAEGDAVEPPAVEPGQGRREALARYALPGFLLLLIAYGFLGIEDLPVEWKIFSAVASGLVFYLLTFADVRIGLGLMLVALAISPEMPVSFGGLDIPLRLEDFLIPIIFLAWLAQGAAHHRPLRWSPLMAPALTLLGILGLMTLHALVIGEADAKRAFFHFLRISGYFLIFLVVLNSLSRPRDLKAFVALLLAACAVVALFGSYQVLSDPEGRTPGPPGETPNIFGGYLVFHAMVGLGLFLQLRTPGARLLLVGLACLVALPLLYGQSRGSWVALVGGVLALGLLRSPKLLVGLVVALAIVPAVVPDTIRERIETTTEVFGPRAPSSWKARTGAWEYELRKVSESPFLGVGVGTLRMGDIDNEYVLKAREGGVLGLLAFLWLLARMLRTSHGLAGRSKDPVLAGFALGYFGGTVALAVHAVGATSFTTIRTMEPFWIATGLLASLENRVAAEEEAAARTAAPPAEELPVAITG